MGLLSKTTDRDNDKKENELPVKQTGSLNERLARVKKTRWVRFGIVSVLFFAWVAWLGSWWVAIFWLLLADIYITQFIPWNGWKFSDNKVLKKVMSWVDAIVYALVLVYFLFLFVGQNYQIPSSSLEKTLLTGDYLWVNKMVYGPRVPQTPLHFPLAQNTLLGGIKSYIENPQWEYHRLKGFRDIEFYDIVVFNYPCGDTVTTQMNNPDYYHLVSMLQAQAMGSIDVREYIRSNAAQFGDVIWRPVDRRDAFVKRCVGLPGNYMKIVNGKIYINGKLLAEPANVQRNYNVMTDGTEISDDYFDRLDISYEGRSKPGEGGENIHQRPPFYNLPLTHAMVKSFKSQPWLKSMEIAPDDEVNDFMAIYPNVFNYGYKTYRWTHNNYAAELNGGKGLWIPKKGVSVALNLDNIALYMRCIKNYEGNRVEVKGGTIYINGKPVTSYTFKMNYYWMMGDNRDNSSDSRYWGFVPEDHVIGTPMFVIASFDKDKSFLNGIRWKRVFINANPDK